MIDAYRCFLLGLESGLVDYDARERDRRIETDRDFAAGAIAQVIDRLAGLADPVLEKDLRIQVDTAAWEQGKDLWTRSTAARELQFLLSHTVHHYALIAPHPARPRLRPGRRVRGRAVDPRIPQKRRPGRLPAGG